MPTPGIYLINSTGESTPLLVEDGSGDFQLLEEHLEHRGYHLLSEEDVINPARITVGKILARLGMLSLVAAIYLAFGLAWGVGSLGVYLLLQGYAYQEQAGGLDDE